MPIQTSVLDQHGNYVPGLNDKDFRVFDNGVAKPIVIFVRVDEPVHVLVMLETSPAVYLIHDEHVAAAYALIDGLAQNDQVAVATYDEAPHMALSFTADKSALVDAIGKAQYTLGTGELNLYDSVSNALDWLPRGKREILLLTTGLDSSDASRWDALVQKLRSRDVVIFAVALGGALREDETGKKAKHKKAAARNQADLGPTAFAKADDALRSLAKMTGGQAYFPRTNQDFAAIYREIASAVRHQYSIGIFPEHDNQFHTLNVEVDRGGDRVFARAGYLAPGP